MAELKTKPNEASVKAFLNSIENEQKKKDALALLKLMEEVSREKARMWGPSIIGFGTYHYKYATGNEGDWMLTGFSPRKQALTLYIMSGFSKYDSLLSRLGKYKTGKSCLYVKRLSDIDEGVLRELIDQSIKSVLERYKEWN